MKKWICILLAVCLFPFAFAGAEEAADWKELYNQKDYGTALPLIQEAADAGDAEAYLWLAAAYRDGNGVEQDYSAALEWYLKAAEAEDPETRKTAFNRLARLYTRDDWDQRDDAKAEEWAEKAAAEGNVDVWYNLGYIALNSEETGHFAKALAYFEKGAAAGSLLALYEEGRIYAYGRGVPVDYEKAKALYEEAAAAGSAYGYMGLAWLYRHGCGVEADGHKAIEYAEKAMEDPDCVFNARIIISEVYDDGVGGVEQDYDKAMELHKLNAEEDGSAASCINVGRRYYLGIGMEKDYAEAVTWFEKAAELGDTNWLGRCYLYGNGVERDYGKAMELFLQAVKSSGRDMTTGSKEAYWYIGYMYERGYGVQKDYATALDWYLQGVEDGSPGCMTKAGDFYLDGKGTEKDVDRAIELYKMAAKLDSSEACAKIGDLYQWGNGVEKNMDTAIAWYEQGAELGSAKCMDSLGWIYLDTPGIEHDYDKARAYFEQGAELGYQDCFERLGYMYKHGFGVEKDPDKAADYYKVALEKAANGGSKGEISWCSSALRELGRATTKVSINEKQVKLLVGGPAEAAETQLTFTVAPEAAFWQDVTWSSSDESIATVDENGLVRGISAGKAMITAATTMPKSTVKGQVSVTVSQAVLSIEPETDAVSVPVKKNVKVKATALPENAADKKMNWSSDNEAVATVKNGQITGKAQGTAVITVTAADGCGASATIQVTVVLPVTKIDVKEKNVTLAAGETCQLTYTVLPEDATDRTVLWTSDKEEVATVDENGLITAVGAGKCTVTGLANDGSKVKVQIKITVK